MADQLQLRGGTTAEHSTFTGALREVTVDTDKDTVVVHDGSTAGGHPLAKQNLSNVPAGTITSTMIADGTIVNADVNASAAIAGTKIAPDFGSQTIQTTGVVSHALGTAAAPTLTFTGDTNTGVYSPGADQVAISTGGSQRLLINNNGISVTGSSKTTGSTTGQIFIESNSGAYAGSINLGGTGNGLGYTAGELYFGLDNKPVIFANKASNGEAMRITADGKLGLGTSSPQALCHVAGGTILLSNSYYLAGRNNANTLSLNLIGRDSSDAVIIDPDGYGTKSGFGGTTLVTTSTGRVGVGTTSPSRTLSVYDASLPCLSLHNSGSGTASSDGFQVQLSSLDAYLWNYEAGNTIFGTSGTERLRIDSSGRVGIGTSSPSSLLHLKGANPQLIVDTPDASTEPRIRLYKNGSPVGQFYGESGVTRILTEGAFQVMTNGGTNAVYVDTSQRVGIGTTNGTAGLSVLTYGTQLGTGANTYMFPSGRHHVQFGNVANGTDVYAGFTSDYATTSGSCNIVLQPTFNNTGQQAGAYIAGEATGLAATAITFGHFNGGATTGSNATKQERARIDSSGRLLVGTTTTSISSSQKFEVKGGSALFYNDSDSVGPIYVKNDNADSGAGAWKPFIIMQDASANRGGLFMNSNDEIAISGQNAVSFLTGTSAPATERMRITSGGFLKASNNGAYVNSTGSYHEIGTNVDNNDALRITSRAGTNPYGVIIEYQNAAPDNNTHYFLNCADSTAARMRVYSDGDVWTSDAGTLTSDVTLKRDITDTSPKLADVMNLRVRNFYWQEDYHPNKQDKKLIGFIAQEFEEVFPGLVSEHKINGGEPIFDEDGNDTGEKTPEVFKKGIKEAKLIPILVKALQEAVERIETLEAKVAALESA